MADKLKSQSQSQSFTIPRKPLHEAPPGILHSLRNRFDTIFPPDRRYLRLSRKSFFIVLIVLLVCIGLAIGLAVGLTRKSTSENDLLPTGKIHTGDLTYYDPSLGACGTTSTSSESICAVSHVLFDAASTSSNPNANPLCGRKIRVTRYNDAVSANRSVDVKVVDRCVGCDKWDLDLSITAFEKLADEDLGRVVGSWAWL